MPYHYTIFDEIPLMIGNPRQDQSPNGGESGLFDSIGSTINYFGDDQRLARRQTFTVEGVYWGEETYFSDDGTGYGDGYALIWGDAETMVRSRVNGLREKVGKWGPLWRERLGDGVLQWKNARLLNVSHPQEVRDRTTIARLSCTFETNEAGWKVAEATTHTKALSASGAEYPYVLEVDTGLPITNAVLTITRGSGSLTNITVRCPTLGIWLSFSGLATSSGSIIIDDGNSTMRHSSGVDVYNYFTFGPHTAKGWLPLPPGQHLFYLTVTGGTATVTFSYYSQYL
jgi:hypothetical protein